MSDCFCALCSLRCDVVMTHTPLEIAVASMYFSLKYHKISQLMPGGMQWYSYWRVTEERIKGKRPQLQPQPNSRFEPAHLTALRVMQAMRKIVCVLSMHIPP